MTDPTRNDAIADALGAADRLAPVVALAPSSGTNPARISEWHADAVAEVRARATGARRMVPIPWRDLDALYGGGLRPGVHTLTGGTGVGKTGFALRLALHAAEKRCPVLYAGLELDRVSILARLAAQTLDDAPAWAALDWPRGADALTAPDQLAAAADRLARLPFYVSEPPAMGWSVADLRREVIHVQTDHGDADGWPVFVVLDFLQLVGPELVADGATHPDDRDLRTRIKRAAYVARQLTRAGDVCVLLVSSVAREHYPKLSIDPAEPTPPLDTLIGLGKESGEIEYAAHTVTALCRTAGRAGEVWAAVAKNRTGGVGWAALDFQGAIGIHHEADRHRRAAAKRMASGDPIEPPKTAPPKGGGGRERPQPPDYDRNGGDE